MYTNKLKNLRKERDITQKKLADVLDISEVSYTNYENEYYIIPTKHFIKLCDYLNVSLDYLLDFTNNENYKSSKKGIDLKKSGENIKNLRKETKLTLVELGNILNCSYGTITGYETGRYLIALPFLYEICKKYGISADYMLGKIDKPKYLDNKINK